MPRFLEMERQSGLLIRGTLRDAAGRRAADSSSGARYSLFAAPRQAWGVLLRPLRGVCLPGPSNLELA